jgi:hypothetical protein
MERGAGTMNHMLAVLRFAAGDAPAEYREDRPVRAPKSDGPFGPGAGRQFPGQKRAEVFRKLVTRVVA